MIFTFHGLSLVLSSIVGQNIGLIERVFRCFLESLVNQLLQLSQTQSRVFRLESGHLTLLISSQGSLETTLGMLLNILGLD